jgi:DNA-binding XRE family transcriptional regulator
MIKNKVAAEWTPEATEEEESFGMKSLRSARIRAGVTHEAMAAALGLSGEAYSHVEANPSCADVNQIRIISELTGVPVAKLCLDRAEARAKQLSHELDYLDSASHALNFAYHKAIENIQDLAATLQAEADA